MTVPAARSTQISIACELRRKLGRAVPELTMDSGPRIRAGLGDPGFSDLHRRASWQPTGAVTDGPYPEAISGFTLVDVPSREEALRWAAKIAVACRCAQEVREIGADHDAPPG